MLSLRQFCRIAISRECLREKVEKEKKYFFFNSCSLVPPFSGQAYHRVYCVHVSTSNAAENDWETKKFSSRWNFFCLFIRHRSTIFVFPLHRYTVHVCVCAVHSTFFFFFFSSCLLWIVRHYWMRDGQRQNVRTKPKKGKKERKQPERKKPGERKIRWIFVGAKFLRIFLFRLYYGWINFCNIHSLAHTASCIPCASMTRCYLSPFLSLLFFWCLHFMCAPMTHLLLHVVCCPHTFARCHHGQFRNYSDGNDWSYPLKTESKQHPQTHTHTHSAERDI